jgi:predicted acetyltransferase
MTFDHPVRRLTDADYPAFCDVTDHAFNSNWPAEANELHRPMFEADRSLGAFDGDQMVGTTAALSFQMTVPGGAAVSVAAVTAVSVLPVYRRRGILSAMMTRQLTGVAAAGEPLAALFASESPIYGRYGYGLASQQVSCTIRRGEGRLVIPDDPAAAPGWPASPAAGSPAGARPAGGLPGGGPDRAVRLRIADPKQSVKDLAAVYDAVRPHRPGMMSSDQRWWDLAVADPEFMRHGAGPQRCVIAEDGSGPRGYALYAGVPEWGDDGVAANVLRIRELFGCDLAAYAALWNDLLTRDLVAEVRANMRPVDDPLLFLLADRRKARSYLTDGLWIRLVDVERALALRAYASPADVVLQVTDHLLPANTGRWRLRAGGGRQTATCEPASRAADLALPVAALGAAYLGGTSIGALAAAGQVTELRAGAVAELAAAMSWHVAPWSPTMF